MKKKLFAMLLICGMLAGSMPVWAEPEDGEEISSGNEIVETVMNTDAPSDADVPAEVPIEASADVPEETAAETPVEASADVPEETAAETPVEAPADVSAAAAAASAAVYAANSFTDVPEWAWYYEAVNFISMSGYMNGVSETEFAPDAGMTRAMFVTVLGRMDGAYVGDFNKKIFPDVESDLWYSQYVNWAFTNNIVSGYEDLSFHPNDEINRAQLAVMIKRYLDYAGYTLMDNPSAYDAFLDESSIPDWAKDGADLMRRTGIITGDSYGGFMPNSVATRAQIAAIVMRMRRVMNGEVLDIPQRQVLSRADIILGEMSLRDKVYQMLALTPEQLTGVNTATMASSATADALNRYPAGMIIYGRGNIISQDQISEMVANTIGYSRIKPFVAIPEESGASSQLSSKLGYEPFKDAYEYRMSDTSEVYDAYASLSNNIKNSGFNVNLAPTSDLWSNPAHTFLGKRCFGNTFEECSRYSLAAIKAIKDTGLLSAVKYFPGYGSSVKSPIDGVCTSDRTLDDLRNYDFNTYKDDIDAGADIVVCANIKMTAIDSNDPVPMSEFFIRDILRNELGFQGIVMTDDFAVKAIAQNYTSANAALKAVEAGCDMILHPDNFEEAANALINAVEKGNMPEDRINESVLRILNKKLEAGIIQ